MRSSSSRFSMNRGMMCALGVLGGGEGEEEEKEEEAAFGLGDDLIGEEALGDCLGDDLGEVAPPLPPFFFFGDLSFDFLRGVGEVVAEGGGTPKRHSWIHWSGECSTRATVSTTSFRGDAVPWMPMRSCDERVGRGGGSGFFGVYGR